MRECADCESAYLDPRPSAESIGAAYAQYYTHADAGSTPSGRFKSTLKRALGSLSGAYVESLAGHRAHGIKQVAAAMLFRALPVFREIIDAQYRHLRRPTPGMDRLLDVGCGGGEFLKRASLLGWRGEGVDFDPKAVAVARAMGLNVKVGSVETYVGIRDAFDVVTCNHVIEHVYDPVGLIRDMFRILKPGGRLWIETPNIGSAGHALFGTAWRGLETPRHLVIFTHDALMNALTRAGFLITHQTPLNIQHVRMVFSCSEAIARHADPHNTRTSLLPNRRLRRGLWREAVYVTQREFVCLRAIKPLMSG